MVDPKANGLVIRQSIFGEGAERVVYAMREANIRWTPAQVLPCDPCQDLLGQEMVAKESRFVEELCSSDFMS